MATNDTFHLETMDFTVHSSGWLSRNPDTFKTPVEEPLGLKKTKKKIRLDVINCFKCGDLITEKHLYAIGENYWHKDCVRCDICTVQIDESGFLIDDTLLCRTCYNESAHVTKCFGCKLPMQTHEVAMYAINQPYHLSCFKCNYCKNLLSKGDKFMFHNGFLICKQDFESGVNLNSHLSQSMKQQSFKSDNPSESNGIRRKTKISNAQRQYLESYYVNNSSPSIKQRAYIADELNLPIKVIQTWFCNYRTKMKMQRNNELKILHDKSQHSDHDTCNPSKMKRMVQQQCFTPDQDCPTTCQISQSTEDHESPQDLSSDLSGMYNCPDVGKTSSYSQRRGETPSHHDLNESVDERGLTYADLSNSCVKSIDRSIMAAFSADGLHRTKNVSTNSNNNNGDFRPQSFDDNQPKTCLTWS